MVLIILERVFSKCDILPACIKSPRMLMIVKAYSIGPSPTLLNQDLCVSK